MGRGGLLDRRAQALDRKGPVATNSNDPLAGAHSERGQHEPLHHLVRVALGQRPVTEGRRIGAHEIGDHDLAVRRRFSCGAPLRGGRVACAAPPPQPRRVDLGDHLRG